MIPEKARIIHKRDKKNHRLRMKTYQGTRTGLKNPKKRVQNASEHRSTFGIQEYRLALLECQMAL